MRYARTFGICAPTTPEMRGIQNVNVFVAPLVITVTRLSVVGTTLSSANRAESGWYVSVSVFATYFDSCPNAPARTPMGLTIWPARVWIS